jgi:hypothetical protein
MNSEIDTRQESLFETEGFRDNQEFLRRSVFIETQLPYMPEVNDNPTPDFKDWSDSGVKRFTNSLEGAIEDITGVQPEDQTGDVLQAELIDLKSAGKWRRVACLTSFAREADIDLDEVDLVQEETRALKAFLTLGLNEARMLPFDEGDPMEDDYQPLSQVSVKMFCQMLKITADYYGQDPEGFNDYMVLAAEIHAEMTCRAKWLYDYTHQLWKTADLTQGQHELTQLLGNALKTKDQVWQESTGANLQTRFDDAMNQPGYGRSEALMALGRETDLIDEGSIVEVHERKLSQLDLRQELIDYLQYKRSVSLPLEVPRLASMRSSAQHLILTDEPLSLRLQYLIDGRLLEVGQAMLTDDSLDDGMRQAVKEQITEIVYLLPKDDIQRPELIKESLSDEVNQHLTAETVSAVVTDRLIERIYEQFMQEVIGIDQAAVWIDEIVQRTLDYCKDPDTKDKFEPLIAIISVYCRLGHHESIPDPVINLAKTELKTEAEALKKYPKEVAVVEKFLTALSVSPEELFDVYWEQNEEYYS